MPRKPAGPAPRFEVIRFSNYLDALGLDSARATRGERSKLRLMAAGARLLDACTYQDLKIEDVASEARLAKGTFYIYFKTKDEFLRELVQRYCDFEPHTMPHLHRDLAAFSSTREWIRWYERAFVANLGLHRCMVQMGAVDPTVRGCWLLRNGRLIDHLVEASLRSLKPGAVNLQVLVWVIRTTGGILDQSLFDRYGLQTPTGRQDPFDDDTIVEMHALLIYRAIYGRDPPDGEIERARPIVALSQALASRGK